MNNISTTKRVDIVDFLKGFGIVLVVIGHALGGLIDANHLPTWDWYKPLFALIYIFHMPLFFFISGLFVKRRVETKPDIFRNSLMSKVVWPYFLWSMIQTSVIFFAGNIVNYPMNDFASNLLTIPTHPPSQFWFLYALFILHLVSLLFRKYLSSSLYLVFSLAMLSLAESVELPYIFNLTARMMPYYAFGVFMGPRLIEGLNSLKFDFKVLAIIPIIILFTFTTYTYSINIGPDGVWPSSAGDIFRDINGFHNFFAASAIIAALFVFAQILKNYLPNWLIYCGKISMPIFLLHVMFVAGSRIFILKFFPETDYLLLLILLIMVGLLMPILVFKISQSIGLSKKLGFE